MVSNLGTLIFGEEHNRARARNRYNKTKINPGMETAFPERCAFMTNGNDREKKPVGYFDLVRTNRNFRFLWSGQVVSLLGDWFNLIASAALISHLTRSGLAVGSLFVIRMLAPFLVSPLAGVMADRYNRKTLLIIADILRGFVVLGFLTVRTPEQAWLLYVITAIQLGFSGFFFPARNAIIPNIVSPSAGWSQASGASIRRLWWIRSHSSYPHTSSLMSNIRTK